MNSKGFKKCVLFIVLLFLFNWGIDAQYFEEDQNYFSYNPTHSFGPHNWEGLCQNGQKQSPLFGYDNPAILMSRPINQLWLKITGGYDKMPKEIRAVNNGFGVYYEFIYDPTIQVPRIVFGPLGNRFYKFHSFSYHIGGEHRSNIRAKICHLEIQYLHFKEEYGTFENAKYKPDGLAVISVCHNTLNNSNTPLLFDNDFLSAVSVHKDIFTKTIFTGSALFTYEQALGFSIMPSYYFYEGSLTVPPCTESVKWLIVKTVFHITQNSLNKFSNFDVMEPPIHNNRPFQERNGRSVIDY